MNLLILILLAVEISDLGVISPRRAVVLDKETERPDFVHFIVELLPQNPPTNAVTLVKTNDLLTAAELVHVPSGRGAMGVRTVYADGSESEVALYRYDLRRGRPAKPSARPIHVLTPEEPLRSATNEIRRVRQRSVTPPPPMPVLEKTAPMPVLRRALPDATNRAYADHLDWMADQARKRRSE